MSPAFDMLRAVRQKGAPIVYKRFLSLLLCLCLAAAMFPAVSRAAETPSSVFAGGSGTAEDPYQIATVEQLWQFASLVNSGDEAYRSASYRLTADLDLGEELWTPIGLGYEHSFRGTFDGGFHYITGVKVDLPALIEPGEGSTAGFFDVVQGGVVENLYVIGEITAFSTAGLVHTLCDGAVLRNCVFNGSTSWTWIDGRHYGSTSALVCLNQDSLVANCCVTEDYAVSGDFNAGLVGTNYGEGKTKNCYISIDLGIMPNYEIGTVEHCFSLTHDLTSETIGRIFSPDAYENGCGLFTGLDGALYKADGTPLTEEGTLLEALNAWVNSHPDEGYVRWTQLPGSYPQFSTSPYYVSLSTETGAYIAPGTEGEFIPVNKSGGNVIDSNATSFPLLDAENRTVYIHTYPGYRLYDVLVDGVSVGPVTQYTFPPATENHTLKARFVLEGSLSNFTMDQPYSGYRDIDESLWYGTEEEGSVRDATALGLFAGNGQGDFLPDANLTLAEVVKLAAVIRSTYRADQYAFDQTTGEHWWDTYVAYALDAGILEPDEFTDFSRPATRGEMAGILERALPDYETYSPSHVSPPDVENPSVFKPETKYNSSISTLYSLGIVQGCDAQGNYHADWNITRAEAAAVVVRLALPDRRLPAPVSQDEANPSADREVKWAETDVSMCIPGNSYYRADQPADLLQEEEAHDKLTVSWTNGVPRSCPRGVPTLLYTTGTPSRLPPVFPLKRCPTSGSMWTPPTPTACSSLTTARRIRPRSGWK